MNGRPGVRLLVLVAVVAMVALTAACSGVLSNQPAAPALVAHKAGAAHALQPKRLETVTEIDMGEMYFGNAQGEKNPTFKLPAGKTVGIHVHNEGTVVHELAIGREMKGGEYAQLLSELVPADLFFYYGQVKAEIEGAKFGELEVEPGIRDVWIRMTIPEQLKGEWEIGCLVEGHYEAGMKAKLIVE